MGTPDAPIGILTFEPILKEKVWGGDRLAAFGKACRAGDRIGESWEVADLASTSVSGGGGGAAISVIARGPLSGRTVHDALRVWGGALCCDHSGNAPESFPLLIKFLDARENLSVQVHPSPAYARAHPEAHLKTESWVVLDAAPGAALYLGVQPGVTLEGLRNGVAEGRTEELLQRVPAVVGRCHHLPTGLVHALGAGVLVAEVQTPSDTTFRLADWGRMDRELHIEQGLACAQLAPPPPATEWAGAGEGELVSTDAYRLSRVNVPAGARVEIDVANATVLMTLSGGGSVHATCDGAPDSVELTTGTSALLPACSQECAVSARNDSPLSVLLARVQTN